MYRRHRQKLPRLSPEMQAIVAGVNGQPPILTALDWERLVRLARTHGVIGLLDRAWRVTPATIPPTVLASFGEDRRRYGLQGALALCQRDEAMAVLEHEGIPCLVLKGAAYARSWYGDLSLRPFADIDLWVPDSAVKRARAALEGAGYRRGSSGAQAHHEAPLYHPTLPCSLELHHGLTTLPLDVPLLFADFFNRSIRLDGEGSLVRTLAPEDMLFHLCLHVLTHMPVDGGWRLRFVSDIARHLDAFSIDWPIFNERVRAAGAERGCAAVLGLAALLVGAQVPREQRDDEAAFALVPIAASTVIYHHRLADFFAALARADMRRASAVFRTMVENTDERVDKEGISAQPDHASRGLQRLVRKVIGDWRNIGGQMRDRHPDAHVWDHSQRVVGTLFDSSPGSRAGVDTRWDSQDAGTRGSWNPTRNPARWRLVEGVPILVLAALALRLWTRRVRVRGASMEPILRDGQRLLVDVAVYRRRSPRRGEIIVFQNPLYPTSLTIKRVIGLPGEVVAVHKGTVLVDGRPLDEPYVRLPACSRFPQAVVPPGQYFVLGDNRAGSRDSRTWGWLERTKILGIARLCYWPPSAWGAIHTERPRTGPSASTRTPR